MRPVLTCQEDNIRHCTKLLTSCKAGVSDIEVHVIIMSAGLDEDFSCSLFSTGARVGCLDANLFAALSIQHCRPTARLFVFIGNPQHL